MDRPLGLLQVEAPSSVQSVTFAYEPCLCFAHSIGKVNIGNFELHNYVVPCPTHVNIEYLFLFASTVFFTMWATFILVFFKQICNASCLFS